MKIQIENLKAQMRGVQLTLYQRALALDEYYKLLEYVEELEQLTIPAVMESVCSCSKGKGIDHDEDGKAYCIDCGKYLEQTITASGSNEIGRYGTQRRKSDQS